MFYIADGRSSFYQWDLNRKICCSDETINELHFYYIKNTVLTVEKKEDEQGTYFNVPNILLQEPGVIRVYAYEKDYTKTEQQFKVLKRPKPEGYLYTETDIYRVEEVVENAIKKALLEAKESGEFDGPQGPQGPQGPAGNDYVITEEDKNELKQYTDDKLKDYVPTMKDVDANWNRAYGMDTKGNLKVFRLSSTTPFSETLAYRGPDKKIIAHDSTTSNKSYYVSSKELKEQTDKINDKLDEYTSIWYAQSPDARIPIFENFRIGSNPITYVSTYAPDLMTQYEVIIDGATQLFKFVRLDVDGQCYLVPDFLIGENGVINNPFGVIAFIDPETLDTTIYSTDNNEHIVSLYQLGIRKLPEEYLPMDSELDETSERPVKNKIVAKAIGALEDYKLKFNIENGSGEGSLQIKGGNAQGKNSVDFSQAQVNYYLKHTVVNEGIFVGKIELFKKSIDVEANTYSKITFDDGSYIYTGDDGITTYHSSDGSVIASTKQMLKDEIMVAVENVALQVTSIEEGSFWNDEEQSFNGFNSATVGIAILYGLKESTGALAKNTFTAGKGTKATKEGQAALGEFNESDDDALIMVGNGTQEAPSNAFVVKKDGEVYAGERAERRLLFADELGDISTALDELHAYAQNLVSGVSE